MENISLIRNTGCWGPTQYWRPILTLILTHLKKTYKLLHGEQDELPVYTDV